MGTPRTKCFEALHSYPMVLECGNIKECYYAHNMWWDIKTGNNITKEVNHVWVYPRRRGTI